MVIGPDFDGISILTDEDDGLCNVVIHQGDNGTLPLFNLCSDDDEDVAQVTHYLPKETPLVGFHANEGPEGILEFGLILLNTLDPMC